MAEGRTPAWNWQALTLGEGEGFAGGQCSSGSTPGPSDHHIPPPTPQKAYQPQSPGALKRKAGSRAGHSACPENALDAAHLGPPGQPWRLTPSCSATGARLALWRQGQGSPGSAGRDSICCGPSPMVMNCPSRFPKQGLSETGRAGRGPGPRLCFRRTVAALPGTDPGL